MLNRALLILLLTTATVFSASAAPVPDKAKITTLPLDNQIALATTPEQSMRHTPSLTNGKANTHRN